MITNGEARDTYYEAFKKADERYQDIRKNSTDYQTTISENRRLSEQLGDRLTQVQGVLDTYYELLNSCQKMKGEDCVEESKQIAEYSTQFNTAISHSDTSIDIASYYDEYIKRITQYLDDMIIKIQMIITSLEDKQTELSTQKTTADEALATAQTNMNNLESESAVLAQREENYYWYKYYLERCGVDGGENEDSGLV